MANDNDDLKKTLQPVAQDSNARATDIGRSNGNTDGSSARKDVLYRYVGNDVTPTFSVAAENDEVVRVIAHNMPDGAKATLQTVFGLGSGDSFTDVCQKGQAIELSAGHNIIVVPFSGRYRVLFKDGWENAADARIAVMRQERLNNDAASTDGDADWQETGVTKCEANKLWRQETNQYGRLRWVNSGEDCGWQGTAVYKCKSDGLYEKEVNVPGNIRWTKVSNDCGWADTGDERCTDHAIYRKQVNKAGDVRWVNSGESCYDPTYAMPCGGWAFGPGDDVDPEATVVFTTCEGTDLGIRIYATARPGATVPIYDCSADETCPTSGSIIGYAANRTVTGVRNLCADLSDKLYTCSASHGGTSNPEIG